ncbi:TPA: hypothetical protein ENS27_10325 [bacterium]|nr:hypothetical protein [bacterium]
MFQIKRNLVFPFFYSFFGSFLYFIATRKYQLGITYDSVEYIAVARTFWKVISRLVSMAVTVQKILINDHGKNLYF